MNILTFLFIGLLPSVAVIMILTSVGGVVGFAGGIAISIAIFKELL